MMRAPAAALVIWTGFSSVRALAAAPDFQLQKVGNGIWAAIVNDQGLAGGNAGFVIGDDGVLVIDTFQDPRPAKALLGEIRKLTSLPIRFVVNTHYHLDHVNGNDVFAAAGATIVAHRNVRAWMRTENIKMLDPPLTPEKKARVESLTLPTVVHDGHIELFLGSRRVNVRYYPGHTGGDSVVSIADAHLVFCGDMLWKEHVPNLIDASTRAWIESLDAMQKDYGPSVWVPGHGGIASAQDVQTFRKYLAALRDGVRREQAAGKSGDALVRTLLPGLKSNYGTWGFFGDYAAAGIEQTSQELLGTKRLPANPPR
ncbi:MAG TPA: MBL fold metallo-hydrolase [Bryobacteraceae bacterium]|jgi:cyclase|nr:MBL fold metallo-hydrolase [Bryobacteraceae bacterium]